MRLYDYPLSDDFSQFLADTRQRIETLTAELNAMRDAIICQNDVMNVRQVEIDSRLMKLENDLYTAYRTQDASAGNILVIHEPFVDNKSCDSAALRMEEAEVVTGHSILTLKRTTSREAAVSSARILDGNGQPGNIHQVYRETNMYHARDGLHASLGYIIDGNTDTWFEYEKICGLPGNKYRNTAFSGGLHWLKFNPATLFMNLELELKEIEVVGAVIVEPFIPSVPGYRPSRLDSIIIDDGRGSRQQLAGTKLDRIKFMACMPQLTRRVKTLLAQNTGYHAWIGIPQKPYPIETVDMKYDPISGLVSQPEYHSNLHTTDEAAIIEQLFNSQAQEVAPALRYQIGLRQISLLAHTYEKASEYISNPYQIPGGIRSVQLDVSYTVPAALIQRQIIKVSISVDDCASWHYIAASDTDAKLFNLPRRIVFGKYVPQFMRSSDTLYMDGQPDALRVKIELFRPDDIEYAQYVTPIVDEYIIIIEQAYSKAGE